MKTISLCPLMLLSLWFFSGCSKHNSKPAKPPCHISSITGNGITYQITYNAAGKVNTVSGSDGMVRKYTYSGNTVVITGTNNGTFDHKTISHLNAAGLPISIIINHDQAGTNWDKINYKYDGNLLNKVTYTSSSGSTPSIINYTNNGSNIVSGTANSTATISFDYYTDKPRQPGGMVDCNILTEGSFSIYAIDFRFFDNKNLMKSITINGMTINLSYDFDSDGKITSMTADAQGSPSMLVQYQYECK